MPFRGSFDCLWCGRPWQVRAAEDLEGWAQLCPDCLGRADDNGFLRARLRRALQERSAGTAASPTPSVAASEPEVVSGPLADDDFYLRRGRFARGPLHDAPWLMELDEATRWLDAQPISGSIVELGAGTGWWSPLLAGKGELWCFDADGLALESARRRLLAHGLVAHLHERDPLGPAAHRGDVVFAACLLGAARTSAFLAATLAAIGGWLGPGGTFVLIEAQAQPGSGSIEGPRGPLSPRDAGQLRSVLTQAGFDPVEMAQTPHAFLMGRATLVKHPRDAA